MRYLRTSHGNETMKSTIVGHNVSRRRSRRSRGWSWNVFSPFMTWNSTKNCTHRAAIGVRELFRLVTPTMAVGDCEFRLPLHYDGCRRPVNCSVPRHIRVNRPRSTPSTFPRLVPRRLVRRQPWWPSRSRHQLRTSSACSPSPCRSRPVCNSGKTSCHQIRAAHRSINSTWHNLQQVTAPFIWPSWRLR